jgi:hypothetical protein
MNPDLAPSEYACIVQYPLQRPRIETGFSGREKTCGNLNHVTSVIMSKIWEMVPIKRSREHGTEEKMLNVLGTARQIGPHTKTHINVDDGVSNRVSLNESKEIATRYGPSWPVHYNWSNPKNSPSRKKLQ